MRGLRLSLRHDVMSRPDDEVERPAFPFADSHGLPLFFADSLDIAICVGLAVLPGLSADAQRWLCRPGWNMMRVMRRGPGVPAEWFSCDVSSHFFCIMLK